MKKCYMCSADAKTKEHFPPKSLFPKGANLQLWTVPSCPDHNNKKSGDDQYFLTQVLMNMSREGNLARERFMQAIAPHFEKSPKYRDMIARDAKQLGDGKRAYPVDLGRMFSVMDGICHALIFRKYGQRLSSEKYRIWHEFLNFASDDVAHTELRTKWLSDFERIATENSWALSTEAADKTAEEVYSYKIFAPVNLEASITVEHSFYGGFRVVSLLTNRQVSDSIRASMQRHQ